MLLSFLVFVASAIATTSATKFLGDLTLKALIAILELIGLSILICLVIVAIPFVWADVNIISITRNALGRRPFNEECH